MFDTEPQVTAVLAEGEISDEVDYAVAMYLDRERGFGLTACKPRLVQIADGSQLVMLSLDSTFRGDDNKIYGYGEVGRIYLDPTTFEVMYCSPADEIEKNRNELVETVEPEERPRGKY
ncbi:MAG: hypothetical protein Q6373_004195 [Candidatus Sigynarchaeota archaeon]